MTLQLYGHPFASFVWKVLIALYERDVPFEMLTVDAEHPEHGRDLAERSPTGQFPVLVDGARTVVESAAIIEYIDLHHGTAAPMTPSDPRAAIEARQMDSIFDDYVALPMQAIVGNALRPEDARDPHGVDVARATLDKSYAWLDRWMREREWAANDRFGLAECAAAPALFYADWAHPIPQHHPSLWTYRERLLARPSVRRVVDEARPYRPYFPLGAPDRD
ncbi:glutathione S-transferase family protein [Consotaella aegiceratis]|uniref:glutathione S-transferase family protein n=1 Tax=Consotaella aegiceratis TaxID=3097961 RepID=UPI002F3FDA02